MTEVTVEFLRRKIAQIESLPHASPGMRDIDGGGGGPHDPWMETRVARLEVEFEHVRQNLDEIKGDQKTIIQRLASVPTVGGLWTMVATVIGTSVGIIAIFVGILTYMQGLHH